VALPGNPTDIALWGDDTTAWVSAGDAVVPIDLATLRAGTPFGIGTGAQALALANGGRTAWVGTGDGTLVPVDLATGRTGGPVRVGGQPTAVVVPPAPVG
jgi:DNA-binding beta-propeller fold protein YncE